LGCTGLGEHEQQILRERNERVWKALKCREDWKDDIGEKSVPVDDLMMVISSRLG
jgi:hypothetical protein